MRTEPKMYTRAPRIRSWRSEDRGALEGNNCKSGATTAYDEAERVFGNINGGASTMERALRSERRKRRANHHSYDLGRHIRLVRNQRARLRINSQPQAPQSSSYRRDNVEGRDISS